MLVSWWSAFLSIYMAATFSLAFLLNLFSLLSVPLRWSLTVQAITVRSPLGEIYPAQIYIKYASMKIAIIETTNRLAGLK